MVPCLRLLVFQAGHPTAPPTRPWSHLGELENVRGVFCFPVRGGCVGDIRDLCASPHQQVTSLKSTPCVGGKINPKTVVQRSQWV